MNVIITSDEREYLVQSMKTLLDTYDYEYDIKCLHSIIDEWAIQKRELIEAFKRHPQYVNGKFMIAYDYDYVRDADMQGSYDFSGFLSNSVIPEYVDTLPREIDEQRKADHCCWLPGDLYVFLVELRRYASKTVTADTAKIISDMLPNLKISEGMKTSRAINKICTYLGYDKHPDYNKEFAKYADSLNPLTVRRHTVLSINPLDYLTMSFGNSWASCHTIDTKNKRGMPNSYRGEYSSGTISYMLDPSSMVLYTVDKEYEGNEFWNQPKITRQMFHYGEDKLVQGRLYPQANDDDGVAYEPYRNFVQEVMSIIFGFPNLWTLKRGVDYIRDHVCSSGTHYKDYYHYDNCTLSRIKDRANNNVINIGANPICIGCGERHNDTRHINCCDSSVRCTGCGSRIDEEDAIYIDGNPYCCDCCFYCEECDEYHIGDACHYIEATDRYVCQRCLNMYYTKCEKCGKYVRTSDTIHIDEDQIYICEECCDEHYFYCYYCDEYHSNIHKRVTDDGEIICSECYEQRIKYELKNEEEA